LDISDSTSSTVSPATTLTFCIAAASGKFKHRTLFFPCYLSMSFVKSDRRDLLFGENLGPANVLQRAAALPAASPALRRSSSLSYKERRSRINVAQQRSHSPKCDYTN